MELRTLQYFLVIAQEENITRAASLLHVTQPTLSRQMMQLEEELGVRLFTRSSHSILLTEQGQLLKHRAQEIVSLADKTALELRSVPTLNGTVAIGSGEYAASKMLAQMLAQFHKLHPAVQFDLYSGNSDEIKERIERGLLDAGLLLQPVDVQRYEFVRVPCREEWGVLVSERSDLAQKSCVTPKDLSDKPLIFGKRDLVKQELLNWFGPYSDHLSIVSTGNLSFNLSLLVQEDLGVFLHLKKACHSDGVCYRPLSPRLESSTVFAWKRNQAISPAAKALIEHAQKYIQGISCDNE